MVEVVVVGVCVQVAEGEAVQFRVGQAVHDVRLEVLDTLQEHGGNALRGLIPFARRESGHTNKFKYEKDSVEVT